MTLSEYDAYITAIDDMETRITDDDKYPVVKDYKINTTGDHQCAYFMCFCCLLPSMCYKLPTVACIHAMCL